MTNDHSLAADLLDKCNELLDVVAELAVVHKFEPTKPIIKNIGMAIGHILEAKKQIVDDAQMS